MPPTNAQAPTLPLCLLDLILSSAPHFLDLNDDSPADNASLSLLQVLPHSAIPTAYASIFCAVNTSRDCAVYEPGPDPYLDLYAVCKLDSTDELWSIVQRWPLSKWMCAPPASPAFLFCARLADALCYRGQVKVLEKLHAGGFDFTRLNVRLFDSASEVGHVDVLEWLASIDLGSCPTTFSPQALVSASKNNHVPVLDWWTKTYFSLPLYTRLHDERTGIKYGCRSGSLDVLRFWFARGGGATFELCHWAQACEHGHVHVLEWALRNADRYDVRFPSRESSGVPTPMDLASEYGHINCLSWFAMHAPSVEYSVHAMDAASEEGRLDVLQWWAQSGLEMKFSPAAHQAAFDNGHHDIVRWWDQCTRFRMVRFGNAHLGSSSAGTRISADPVMLASFGRLEWMPELASLVQEPEHVLWHMRSKAAQHGHLHVLQRYRQLFRHLQVNEATLVSVARSNQCAALEWLVRNTSQSAMPASNVWGQVLVEAAKAGAYLAIDWILEYVRVQVLELKVRDLMPELVVCAAEAGKVNALDVLVGKGAHLDDPYDESADALSAAAQYGHVNVFAWWKDRGFAFPDTLEKPMELACVYDDVELVRWNVEAGKVLPISRRALQLARANGSVHVMRYCLEEGRVEVPAHLRHEFEREVYPASDQGDR